MSNFYQVLSDDLQYQEMELPVDLATYYAEKGWEKILYLYVGDGHNDPRGQKMIWITNQRYDSSTFGLGGRRGFIYLSHTPSSQEQFRIGEKTIFYRIRSYGVFDTNYENRYGDYVLAHPFPTYETVTSRFCVGYTSMFGNKYTNKVHALSKIMYDNLMDKTLVFNAAKRMYNESGGEGGGCFTLRASYDAMLHFAVPNQHSNVRKMMKKKLLPIFDEICTCTPGKQWY
eukprot:g14794.t1